MPVEQPIVDLDRPDTWPEGIITAIEAEMAALVNERELRRTYDLSGDRWSTPSPDCPVTTRLTAMVESAMKGRWIRVFHASRLLDFEKVKREGLRPLEITERIASLKALTASGPMAAYKDSFDQLIAQIDLTSSFYSSREGDVWACCMRRALHDDGCDVFFQHWGGECIQRLTAETRSGMQQAIQQYGVPAVVVARIPAYGFASGFQESRLAPTMIKLVIERAGLARNEASGWDVQIEGIIPPEWIEGVYTLDNVEVIDTPKPSLLD